MTKVLKPKKILEGINMPLEISETEEGRLIQQIRGARSYRDCADYLNERIPEKAPGRTTYGSVWNWETGVHPVGEVNLWAWQKFYREGDARHQLALSVLGLRRAAIREFDERNGQKLLEAVTEKANGKQHKAGVR